MYIMTQDGKQIINSDFVARFVLVEKPDATIIVASYVQTDKPVTMGRYARDENSTEIIADMFIDLSADKSLFFMPNSRLRDPEKEIKDARVKRKGGS